MLKGDYKEAHVGRCDFMKTTAMAGLAAGVPGTNPAAQNAESSSKQSEAGRKTKLLCLNGSPDADERFAESIKSILGTDLLVTSVKANYQNPQ